jgi:hypothetical protein
MKKIRLTLSREAMLFDSPLYILKGFLSMMTAYLLFHNNALVGKDMISIFFGMMMTLEPINVSGLKTGWDQIQATILGGVVTAVICMLFGINWFTIPLSVALTMFISLVLNWRFVSPVAIFTAIYMTQFIQLNAAGEVSMLLTLRLRLLALAAGVLVAVFYNYVFSLFFYKGMLQKRLIFIIEQFEQVLSQTGGEIQDQIHRTIGLISDMDSLNMVMADIEREKKKPVKGQRLLKTLRTLAHYWMDYLMDLEAETVTPVDSGVMLKLLAESKHTLETNETLASSEHLKEYQNWTGFPKLVQSLDKLRHWIEEERL